VGGVDVEDFQSFLFETENDINEFADFLRFQNLVPRAGSTSLVRGSMGHEHEMILKETHNILNKLKRFLKIWVHEMGPRIPGTDFEAGYTRSLF